MSLVDRFLRAMSRIDIRRQMGMSRREYNAFIDECHDSEPWYGDPGYGSNNYTIYFKATFQ